MGQSKSKLRKPKNAVDNLAYREQKRKQKQIEDEKRRKNLEKEREKKEKKRAAQIAKKKNKKKKDISKDNDDVNSNAAVSASNFKIAFRMEDYDNRVALKIDEQISTKFAHFCLNQIVLSTQFYGNYQSEKSSGYEEILKKETKQNQNLDKHSILLPNALDEAVQNRIQYKPKHGYDKHVMTPLQLQTMYVIFENVEISKPDDANYDSINPICKVDIDTNIGRSKKFKGYLRLRLREISLQTRLQHPVGGGGGGGDATVNSSKLSNSSIDSYFEKSIYIDSKNDGLKLLTDELQYDTLKITRDSNSSGIDVTGSEYAYIRSLNTHQPLSELSISKKLKSAIFNAKVVPESCITVVEYYPDEMETDDEDDNDNSESESDIIEIKYLNSKSFFCYFATVLKDNLGQDLNLQDIEFDSATWKGASIFTKSYEIIPAIHIPCWPDCAFEWKYRERPILQNPLSGQKLQWPTQDMIKKIESFGCHVIPMGYAPKIRKNPYRELEWKIVFPKAERFLESYLTDTQVKIFMISKLLIKTFLQQKKDIFMFTMDHLRMHLFWECEKNYGAWPEEFLGEVLLRFLRSFLEKTRSKCLNDYFIKERNLFECIPESTLVRIHEIISQIVQNPVLHLLVAYRNLEQLEPYFPKLNYKKLYSIITIDNPLNLLDQVKTCVRRNRILMQMNEEENKDKQKDDYVLAGKDDENSDEEDKGLIGFSHKQERKGQGRRTKRLKSRIKSQSMRKKIKDNKPIKKDSIDSIDLQQYIFSTDLNDIERAKKKNISAIDDIRRSLTIEMFIKQFIHQAKTSYELKSLDKARIYLNQASRLCSFMAKYGYEDDSKNFLTKIDRMRNSFGSLSEINPTYENPPALPERTSLEPVKSFRLGEVNHHVSPSMLRKQKINSLNENRTSKNDKIRSVRFEEEIAFEPRSFAVEVDLHESNVVLTINNNCDDDSNQHKPKKQVSIEDNSNKTSRTNSVKSIKFDSPRKQISLDENFNIRKSILRVNSKNVAGIGKISNGVLKQSSIESSSSQNEMRSEALRYHHFSTDDDDDDDDSESKLASVSSTTTSEMEENTAGLTYKEIFERRKNLIHRKLISSLTLQPNDYYSSSDSEDNHRDSTDL